MGRSKARTAEECVRSKDATIFNSPLGLVLREALLHEKLNHEAGGHHAHGAGRRRRNGRAHKQMQQVAGHASAAATHWKRRRHARVLEGQHFFVGALGAFYHSTQPNPSNLREPLPI